MQVLVAIFLTLSVSWSTHADIPIGCQECLMQCPHNTKSLLACDRGCPDQCSTKQVDEYKKDQALKGKAEDCFSCMNQCPHMTKIMLACDRGCPSSCNEKSLKAAFFKLKAKNVNCAKTPVRYDPESDPAAAQPEAEDDP